MVKGTEGFLPGPGPAHGRLTPGFGFRHLPSKARRGKPGEGSGWGQVAASQPAGSTRVGGATLGCCCGCVGSQGLGQQPG